MIPPSAFVDPRGRNKAEVERLARQVLDLILGHLHHAADRAPLPAAGSPAPATIPDEPTPEGEILERLRAVVAGSMNAAHPAFIGHMDSMPTTLSLLGELVSAALNNNMLSVEMSAVFSDLESRLLKQFAGLFGLGSGAGGVMLSGGSLANLQALAVARNSRFRAVERGVAGLSRPPALFASDVAHTSIQKAAMLLGLGTSSVVPVRTNGDSQMDVSELRRAIERAERDGREPFCVVATAGTTTTGNIDLLSQIGDVAREHGLWFHVDAAYGGALILSPAHRRRLAGIERADSVTFNPQKWLYVAKTCAMVLFRDMGAFIAAFRVQAPYMRDASTINLGEISVQGTRHAEVLKLWLSLQHLGRTGYSELIDASYRLTAQFVGHVRRRPLLQLAGEPETNLVCFRGVPSWIPEREWDDWNARLQASLLSEASTFLSLPAYRGHRWLRAVLLNPYTDAAVIDRLFDHVDDFAKRR